MEQRLSPQLTRFAAAQAFHAVTQLVLELWQHVHRNVLPGRKQGSMLGFTNWMSTILERLYLVFTAAHTSGVAQSNRTAHHEQQIVQTVEFVDQIALFWSIIVLFIFSTSLQLL